MISFSSSPLSVVVPSLPPSLPSLSLSLSGPSQILIREGEEEDEFCWIITSLYNGGRGVIYNIRSENEILNEILEVETIGWVEEGKGRVCVKEEDLEEMEAGGEYGFSVEGRSELFGTIDVVDFSFNLSFSSDSRRQSPSLSSSPRQTSCSSSLWDSSPSSLYAIQTTPSGHTLLPSSLRSQPLTITTKALLSPCGENNNEIQYQNGEGVWTSKDILSPAGVIWSFLSPVPEGLVGKDIGEWGNGTRIIIPTSILKNRTMFPPGEGVGMRVRVEVEDGEEFSSDVVIEFMDAPVVMVGKGGEGEDWGGEGGEEAGGGVFVGEDGLVVDFEESYTLDGVVVGGGEWVWEWEWVCIIPGEGGEEGRRCEYEGGEEVVMPGEREGRFESEEGKTFERGVPLFFYVKSRVREGEGGEVVAEGEWSGVFSVVGREGEGLEVVRDEWICEDSSIGYTVLFIYFLFKLLFFFD